MKLVLEFLLEETCPSTARDCSINNATHSGLTLPSPTICNCCPYCLPLYNKGKPCSLGGAGAGVTVGRCGHGLTCDRDTQLCVRMKTKCHDAQDDYDNRYEKGETGIMETRPECDEKGNYAPYVCIPSQTCFCQSEDGEKLFGEIPYTGVFVNMPCQCSRMAHKIEKLIGKDVPYPVFGLRCTSNGNFNPVQCLNNICYCVDPITGVKRGDKTIDLTNEYVSNLPCYDANLDLNPPDEDAKPPFNYTTPCYGSIQEREALLEQSRIEGYNIDYFSSFAGLSCLPDGTFGRISVNSTGSRICVNEHGERLGDYSAELNTPEYTNMDCKCALTAHVMRDSNEPPHCCKNGNFRPIQCRLGQCRCVDSDGRQVGLESTDVTRLACYTPDWRHC
ncbi:uncharacterized protein LOC123667740 [Melitaea cinxia]|uniref:uncharacterized protein LOC123667740 n=1 Tax=Melitaea cinxia TaxID=113334 RepID=UPI001E274B24|nr:uncharacterized protein LOC123667740 [Melitaea cinxia]